MKAVKKKARCDPPWWCKMPLYAATWPRPEFYDYRIKLQRGYLRSLRRGRGAATKYARRQAIHWTVSVGWRIINSVASLFRAAGP